MLLLSFRSKPKIPAQCQKQCIWTRVPHFFTAPALISYTFSSNPQKKRARQKKRKKVPPKAVEEATVTVTGIAPRRKQDAQKPGREGAQYRIWMRLHGSTGVTRHNRHILSSATVHSRRILAQSHICSTFFFFFSAWPKPRFSGIATITMNSSSLSISFSSFPLITVFYLHSILFFFQNFVEFIFLGS